MCVRKGERETTTEKDTESKNYEARIQGMVNLNIRVGDQEIERDI